MHGASSKHQYLAKKICIPSNSCPEMQVQWNLSFKTPLFRGHRIWSRKSVQSNLYTYLIARNRLQTLCLKGELLIGFQN